MRLHYHQQGHGSPLIILHGLFGSLDNWAFVSRQLSEHFQVFAVDQRNHGRSPHDPEINYAVLAEDLGEFMAAQGLPRACLLGHSMGGKAAMQFALQNPARVDGLIVVDMAPRAYRPVHHLIFESLLALDLKSFQTRGQIDAALTGPVPDLATRRFLVKGLIRSPEGAFAWKFNLRGLYDNYPSLNAAVESDRPFKKPALFIRGEKSDYIGAEDLPEIRRLFPAAKIVTLPGAGHWVHAEAAELFLIQVKDFLERKVLTSSEALPT
jgi:pimeloyl-ACP methyl ester carboxylesterase